MISRRGFVTGAGIAAGALVMGFNPVARQWVTAAEAATTPFADLPPLDGEVVYDAESREANSRDLGRIIFRTPNAILRPGSVADIQKMIRYCRAHTIKVAPIGAHHAMFGQALVDGGLIIEMRSLRTIHSISAQGADVDAGVYWKDVILDAYSKGLTPASITGYIKTTVGGTLSMGGIGVMTTYKAGAQIDHVQQLQVVTGTGELVTCSKTQNSDLFHAVLGGHLVDGPGLDMTHRRRRGRGGRAGVGGLPNDRRCDEQQGSESDQSVGRGLRAAKTRELGRLDPAEPGDGLHHQAEGHEGPRGPADHLEQAQDQGAVVGCEECVLDALPARRLVGDRVGSDREEEGRQADDDAEDGDRGEEPGQPLAQGGRSHRSMPPWARMSRADASPETLIESSPMIPRNLLS